MYDFAFPIGQPEFLQVSPADTAWNLQFPQILLG